MTDPRVRRRRDLVGPRGGAGRDAACMIETVEARYGPVRVLGALVRDQMSYRANGSGANVKFADVQRSPDGVTPGVVSPNERMRFQVHSRCRVGMRRGAYPCPHRLGQRQQLMPQGGE